MLRIQMLIDSLFRNWYASICEIENWRDICGWCRNDDWFIQPFIAPIAINVTMAETHASTLRTKHLNDAAVGASFFHVNRVNFSFKLEWRWKMVFYSISCANPCRRSCKSIQKTEGKEEEKLKRSQSKSSMQSVRFLSNGRANRHGIMSRRMWEANAYINRRGDSAAITRGICRSVGKW